MDQSETPERGFQQDPLGKENRRAGKYENLTPPPTSHFDGSDFDLVLPSTSIAAAIAALRGGSLLHPLGPDPNQCRDESPDAEKLGVSQAARLLPHVVQRREKVRHVLHGAQARLVRRPTRPGRVLQHWFRARAPARELGLRDESEKGKRDREGERQRGREGGRLGLTSEDGVREVRHHLGQGRQLLHLLDRLGLSHHLCFHEELRGGGRTRARAREKRNETK